MENAEQVIEALIFASEKSITTEEIISCLHNNNEFTIESSNLTFYLQNIINRYKNSAFAIELVQSGGGYQFLTKPQYYSIVNQLQTYRAKRKLSQAALETLAIIASKQQVTKLDIEHIRGVNSDYTVQKLLEKELIKIIGKANLPGKPVLFGVSENFLDHFGLNSVADIPQLKDIENKKETGIGQQND